MVVKKKYVLVRDPVETPKPKRKIVRDEDILKAIPITLGDEVQQALEEWYVTRGEKLPDEYIGFGGKVDADEKAYHDTMMEAAYPSDPSLAPKQIGPKPEFGTPEFWKWAHQRRAEKNAERAAKGLPPLPTKGAKVMKNEKVEKIKAKVADTTAAEVTRVKKIKIKKAPLEAA